MQSNKEKIENAIEALCDLEDMENDIIFNVENFRLELERANLMTKELDEFIENYMTFDND